MCGLKAENAHGLCPKLRGDSRREEETLYVTLTRRALGHGLANPLQIPVLSRPLKVLWPFSATTDMRSSREDETLPFGALVLELPHIYLVSMYGNIDGWWFEA